MSKPIILDLCGGTGAWSQPYRDAGYDVRLVTLPDDVRYYKPPRRVHGVLAAPPCTDFASSGTRWWKAKDKEKGLLEGLSIVAACLRVIEDTKPKWWALENPVGRLPRYIGKWRYTFQPFDYGDPWTKRTCIWGEHTIPTKTPVAPVGTWQGSHAAGKPLGIVDHPLLLLEEGAVFLPPDWIHKLGPSADRAEKRSITSPGFARAFFEANP
ncbi:hypothetical protein LCGC14_1252230 [marine sediment metagenome]|uniref:DNA (cytosine-5-)-methyltransferase n=1 Tax=marine sediment metagenome TaxID=412755 RepID=A0A0F9NJT2_9ZZZZ